MNALRLSAIIAGLMGLSLLDTAARLGQTERALHEANEQLTRQELETREARLVLMHLCFDFGRWKQKQEK